MLNIIIYTTLFRPVPSVIWYRYQSEFPTRRHIFKDDNRTLTIMNITRDDEGEYQCIGRSSGQSSEPIKFMLLVHGKYGVNMLLYMYTL